MGVSGGKRIFVAGKWSPVGVSGQGLVSLGLGLGFGLGFFGGDHGCGGGLKLASAAKVAASVLALDDATVLDVGKCTHDAFLFVEKLEFEGIDGSSVGGEEDECAVAVASGATHFLICSIDLVELWKADDGDEADLRVMDACAEGASGHHDTMLGLLP